MTFVSHSLTLMMPLTLMSDDATHQASSFLPHQAENERMHLLTFFELRKPGPLFRAMVVISQVCTLG